MAYDYKPGEDSDVLKKYLVVGTILVALIIGAIAIIYVGLGIDSDMLKILASRTRADAATVTFVFAFVMASIALWGLFREPAAGEGVNRRQSYFILLLIVAGVAVAGTIFFKKIAEPAHEVTKTEVCSRCQGDGRARLRPEYPCGACDGTGFISP